MKMEKLEKFQNKMGLKGFKWSNFNAPGTDTPVPYPLLGNIPIRAWALLGRASHGVTEKAFNGASRGDRPVKIQSCDIRGYAKRG